MDPDGRQPERRAQCLLPRQPRTVRAVARYDRPEGRGERLGGWQRGRVVEVCEAERYVQGVQLLGLKGRGLDGGRAVRVGEVDVGFCGRWC